MEEKDQKTSYVRLDSSNFSDSSGSPTEEKKSVANSMDVVYVKAQALVWVILSLLFVCFTDFFEHLTDSDGSKTCLFFMSFFLTINCILFLYATVYLPYVLKVKLPCSIYSPRLIPLACISWVFFFLSISTYYFEFYGFLAPFLILFLLFGLLNTTHFIPSLGFLQSLLGLSSNSPPVTVSGGGLSSREGTSIGGNGN